MHPASHNRHSSQSRDSDPGALSPAALDLLDAAPAELRFWYLRGRLPHLLERIATAWPDPLRMVAFTQALEDDGRRHRSGLPSEARRELEALRVYYFTVLHPELAPLITPADRPLSP